MQHIITGKTFYCGDFVDTDVMAPGRFEPFNNMESLARIALIDYESNPPFVNPETGRSIYSIIVAGNEFGCGSSRETAPQALHYAGTRVIIAKSFARIFFRNCINMGLLFPIIYDHPFKPSILGTDITIDFTQRYFQVHEEKYFFNGFGPLNAIIEAGGLTAYNKKRLLNGDDTCLLQT